MAARSRTKQILGGPAQKAIASRPMEQVYQLVTEAGVYLACCGFLDSANELLANLWGYKLNHSPFVRLADRAMSVLWHHAGRTPSAVPFEVAGIDSIELEHRRYMTGNQWSDSFLLNTAVDPKSLAIKRLAKAMIASYPRKAGPMPQRSKDLEAAADFAAFAESEFCVGYNAFSALTNLVELCSKLDMVEDATRYLLRWQVASMEYWSNFSFADLASCRHAAPLLAQGVLAPGYQLDAKSSEEYVQALCKSLQQRMTAGRTLVFRKLSWQQLLEKISKKAITLKLTPFSPQTKKAKWLGCPPASASAIEEATRRLGAPLPEDYVSFLLVSDGFQATSPTSVPVFAIDEVRWLRDAMPDLVKAWDQPATQEVCQSLKESLLIGDLNGEQQLLLVPNQSGNDKARWECWFFASWIPGEDRHPSFRAYMEQVLLELQEDVES